jgi:hypothetical protein
MLDEAAPRSDLGSRNVDWGDLVEEQKLGQLLGVNSIILPFGTEDQSQLARMCDYYVTGHSAQSLKEISVTRGCLKTNSEGFAQAGHFPEKRRRWSLDCPRENFSPSAIENADRGLTGMGIQTNITHV